MEDAVEFTERELDAADCEVSGFLCFGGSSSSSSSSSSSRMESLPFGRRTPLKPFSGADSDRRWELFFKVSSSDDDSAASKSISGSAGFSSLTGLEGSGTTYDEDWNKPVDEQSTGGISVVVVLASL